MAPRLVVVHTKTHRERITRTDHSDFAGRDSGRDFGLSPESSSVRGEAGTRAIQVWNSDVRSIHPAQLRVVLGVPPFSDVAVPAS